MTIRWPPAVDRPLLAAAAAIWVGVSAASSVWVAGCLIGTGLVAALRVRRATGWLVVVALALGFGSGTLVGERHAALVDHGVGPGRIEAVFEARTDAIDGPYGAAIVGVPVEVSSGQLPRSPVILADWDRPDVVVGDRFQVIGSFTPGISRLRRSVVAGRISVSSSVHLDHRAPVHLRLANVLRDRVIETVQPHRSEQRALLAGFLIGDTSELSTTSLDSMRRAGLTHYVAVSGSNVALFLLLWWLLLGPIGLRGWWRTSAGLFGLAVFAALTRWEPSVIRASLAAAVLLVGRSIGVPLSSWATLALAVSGALLVAGELATDVGFQLSVLAAIGVLAGSDVWRFRPTAASTALSASVSAQLMVSPVLLVVFGSVPVLSPIANVLAGPLVVAATSIAGLGVVVGSEAFVIVASWFSGAVLTVANTAAPWPQVEWVGWLLIAGSLGLLARFKPSFAAWVVALAIAAFVWPISHRLGTLPAVVFLDVGQGDATLLLDDGLTVLIDGGPDPVVLARKLERYGVTSIDVVVASHVHADHINGLEAVFGRLPVGLVVADFEHHTTAAAEWLLSETEARGIDLVAPEPGWAFGTSTTRFEVLGPLRRYASPNDESVVLLVTMAGERILMSGDMETFAQADLRVAGVDVLKVPHQGAATSDLAWLADHAGHTAVVSVGPNDFGHPAPDVLTALTAAGADIHRTDVDGDLVFRAGGATGERSAGP